MEEETVDVKGVVVMDKGMSTRELWGGTGGRQCGEANIELPECTKYVDCVNKSMYVCTKQNNQIHSIQI